MSADSDNSPSPEAPSWPGVVSSTLCIAITALGIAWAFDLPGRLGLIVFREQFLAAIYGCALGFTFVQLPARRGDQRLGVPWYDALAAAVASIAAFYVVVRYPVLARDFFYRPTETFIVGFLMIIPLIEALRRATGYALVIILLVFILYGLLANLAPGHLSGRSQSFPYLMAYLGLDSVALLGIPLYVVGTIVIVYVFLGQLLLRSGGSAFFTDISMALMGGFRGGSAKIAVLSSALFGSISGSATSNVATTGVLTIPLMKSGGYRPRVAGAIEAVASTGGQLMPPIMGAAAFLIAEFLQIHYREVVIAALIPAVLYFLAVLIQADLTAARDGITPIPRAELPRIRHVLAKGFYLIIPFAVLVYVLFYQSARAETAALAAAIVIILLGLVFSYKGHRLRARDLLRAMQQAGSLSAEMILIGAMAGVVIGVIQVTGLGFGLSFMLVQFGQGSLLLLLLLTAVICILLGMGLPTTAIYFLLATLIAPPLVQLGIEPLAAHLFIMYFGMMSMITPPVCFAAFVAANLARAEPMQTGFTAVMFAWPAFIVPFLFVYSPTLIMQGPPLQVIVAALSAIVGVWLCSGAIMGYLLGPLNGWKRMASLGFGLCLLTPEGIVVGDIWLDVIGAVGAASVAGSEYLNRRRRHERNAEVA